jgi:hypothetical protein
MRRHSSLLIIALCAFICPASAKAQAEQTGLTVHEWGTFTSIAGQNGSALEWRPLTEASDLPQFVYRFSTSPNQTGFRSGSNTYATKRDLSSIVRMETPVIFFYTPTTIDVSLSVSFKAGKITEWYPKIRGQGDESNVDWGKFRVIPQETTKVLLPIDRNKSNHYYAARHTDASVVQVCSTDGNEYEKFLFYRGVGNFTPPLNITLDEAHQMVRLENTSSNTISNIILFQNQNGSVSSVSLRPRNAKTKISLSLPLSTLYCSIDDQSCKADPLPTTIQATQEEFKKVLIENGLFEKEAAAMIDTWKDSWFEEGFRALYVLPRKTTDEILPVKMEPLANKFERVMICRTELITKKMKESFESYILQLESPSAKAKAEASRFLHSYGRFAEPILREVLANTKDPELKTKTESLLKEGFFSSKN